MYNYIKYILRRLFNTSSYDLHRKNDILKKQVESSRTQSILSPLITNWPYIPVTNAAAGPKFYAHICNDIIINKRKYIVELGSGISTIIISRLIKLNALNCCFYSIDHDIEWQTVIQNNLKISKIDNNCKFLTSNIVKCGDFLWYDSSSFPVFNNIDCLIVDGPIGNTKFSRYGAVPYFKDLLSCNGYSIFLHDTDRDDENEIINIWKNMLEDVNLNNYIRYSILSFNSKYLCTPQTCF